jgi:hypothetical protein
MAAIGIAAIGIAALKIAATGACQPCDGAKPKPAAAVQPTTRPACSLCPSVSPLARIQS